MNHQDIEAGKTDQFKEYLKSIIDSIDSIKRDFEKWRDKNNQKIEQSMEELFQKFSYSVREEIRVLEQKTNLANPMQEDDAENVGCEGKTNSEDKNDMQGCQREESEKIGQLLSVQEDFENMEDKNGVQGQEEYQKREDDSNSEGMNDVEFE